MPPAPPPRFDPGFPDAMQECLTSCLDEISEHNRELLINYYNYDDSSVKAVHRVTLAERMGLSQSALQVRAFRVRRAVGDCVRNCLNN